jgi:hypothetical protein
MDSSYRATMVCLNIAIDHRIKALFKPVTSPPPSANDGDHLAVLQAGGDRLQRSQDEILVTRELAGPTWTGGIAVALLQPRDDHPFEMGTQAVIDDCDTLLALEELFPVISCGSLRIMRDVSIIDLLPFVTKEQVPFMDEELLSSAFQTSQQAFCAKKPDVVLCAGRHSMEHREFKGQVWRLESKGVGRLDNFPVVTLAGREGEIVRIRRVNCFHPSYALFYNGEHSCLRQLLLLEAAKACGVYRDDWKEEGWMGEIRSHCRDIELIEEGDIKERCERFIFPVWE